MAIALIRHRITARAPMPRKPRSFVPGLVYHLISRFVDREWFIKDAEDRSLYLDLLGRAVVSSDWQSLGYAVMNNHFHHAVVAGSETLASWIRRVHSPFADWLNKKQGRIGNVFVRGPKDLLVQPDGVAHLLAYIHNNPVRAGVVGDASASTWTSHRAYGGLSPAPRWLRVDEGLARAGFGDARAFDAFVRSQPVDPVRDRERERRLLEDDDAHESFHVNPVPISITPEQIIAGTALRLGIDAETLRSRRRTRSHVYARHVAAHCADRLGISGAAIASALGVTQQAVSLCLKSAAMGVVEVAASIADQMTAVGNL